MTKNYLTYDPMVRTQRRISVNVKEVTHWVIFWVLAVAVASVVVITLI